MDTTEYIVKNLQQLINCEFNKNIKYNYQIILHDISNDFLELINSCFYLNTDINLVYGEFIINQTINYGINPLDIIIHVITSYATTYNINDILSPTTSSNFIKNHNQYFNSIKKIRKLLYRFINNTEYFINNSKKDIIYIISSFIFYKKMFDKDYEINKTMIPGYQLLINNILNFNPKEVIDIIRILYHYRNFVKYFNKSDEFNFTYDNPNIDFSKTSLNYVYDDITNNISDNINFIITNDTSELKLENIKSLIDNIKIYTSLDLLRDNFCEYYIAKLNRRYLTDNFNCKLENILLDVFDINTNISYINRIKQIINQKENSNQFNNYIHNYNKTQINIIEDKYANLNIPNLENININIVNNNINTLLPEVNEGNTFENIDSPQLELYLKLVSSMYRNFTNDTMQLNYDIVDSLVTINFATDKEYTITCNLLQYLIIDYINTHDNVSIDDIKQNFNNYNIDSYVNSLITNKLLKYKDNTDASISFTLSELNNLVNSLNLVTQIKDIINSRIVKTKFITINSDFKHNNNSIDFYKLYLDDVRINSLLNFNNIISDMKQINNKTNECDKLLSEVYKDNSNIIPNQTTKNNIMHETREIVEENGETVEYVTQYIEEYVDEDDNNDEDDENCEDSGNNENSEDCTIYQDGEEIIEIIEEVYEEEVYEDCDK